MSKLVLLANLIYDVLLQIRSLRAPSALVQTVVLRDVQKLVQTDNCILAALSNSVYGLLPVPIGAQVWCV
jgi:hypothetical protein